MKRILRPFRGLQWKLTLAYMLVTVGVSLVFEIIVLTAQVLLVAPPPQYPGFLAQALLSQSVPRVVLLLERTPADRDALEVWMHEMIQGDVLWLGSSDDARRITHVRSAFLAVVDVEGRVVAAVPGDRVALDSFLPAQLSHQEAEVLRSTLDAPNDPTRMWVWGPGESTVAAAPVFGEKGRFLGALFLSFSLGRGGPSELSDMLEMAVLPSLLFLLIFAGILGALFGFLTARWLAARIRALSTVTDAWGRGDFATFIHATSGDELGQLARQLNRMAEQLQNLLQAREELAALEERNRLARDLHDSVKQQVFAVTMTLGGAQTLWERDPDAARQKLSEAVTLSRQAQQELAGLIHELRPVELEGKGLAAALEEYAERWSRRTGIAVQVTMSRAGTLPLEMERVCFRVVQEALANVARHSGAGQGQVTLESADGGVNLAVVDDGCGFDTSVVEERGFGLRSMRERVEARGGQLAVDSAPGKGTRVTVQCGAEVRADERAD